MFFLATADADGWPDCSYKGGKPGFVRVVAADTLAFPSYDGNGMFKSLGNVLRNAKVGPRTAGAGMETNGCVQGLLAAANRHDRGQAAPA